MTMRSYILYWGAIACHVSLSPTATLAATVCPSIQSQVIPTNFLNAIKPSQTNVFVPSAYFTGSAVKMVSAANLTNFYHSMICVDGATTPVRIYLRDDGLGGDDVAGDGIYTRSCVHFCESIVNYTDMWNFAYHQTIQSADLIAVKPNLQGKIPYHVIKSPKYPTATVYATSHAAFFVDDQRYYLPNWPIDTNWDYAGARNVATSAILDIFGDVFDWFTMTPFDFNMQYCAKCKAIPGFYSIKYHGWVRVGALPATKRPGELQDCDFAMTGFPILRMIGGVSNEDMLTEFLGQIHELLHACAGFNYQANLPKARAGDKMHVPGACTTDHSQLQGPLWDWVLGYPTSIPLSYCVGIPGCYEKAYDLVRLQANSDCDACPDANLTSCCSFRYEDAINTRDLMLSKPELYQASPLLQHIAGVLPYAEFPVDKRTYYCMGSDTDGGCGLNRPKGPCNDTVYEFNRSFVKSTYVTRFTLDELISSNGGFRDPPSRKERDFRHAPIHIGQRVPTEAEMVFRTLFWRYHEQEASPWTRTTNAFNNRRVPLVTWQYATNSQSTIHSRLHGIPCGGGVQVKSCIDNATVCDGFDCGANARCYPFDGRPLCVCNDGYWGDGNLCIDPKESASYNKIYPYLWSAHDLYYNGSNAEYYPKYTVKQWCYGDKVDWPSRITKDKIEPYPGGLPQYALMGCGSKLCKLSERCWEGLCIPLNTTGPLTRTPSAMPSKTPSRAPSLRPSRRPSRTPSQRPSRTPSSRPSLVPANFSMIPTAVKATKTKCGCKLTSSRLKCVNTMAAKYFQADLTAGRVKLRDKTTWRQLFDQQLAAACSI